jgi:hypothetical protein
MMLAMALLQALASMRVLPEGAMLMRVAALSKALSLPPQKRLSASLKERYKWHNPKLTYSLR